jgi:RNA polymerase sigma-70 factor (ECF subfamily)
VSLAPPDLGEGTTSADSSLLRQVCAGDDGAAAKLYDRYASRIRDLVHENLSRAVAARVDDDDIVQSVFRRFFSAMSQGRYTLPSCQELWHLLVVITLNRLRSEEQFQRALKRDVGRTSTTEDPACAPRCREDPEGLNGFLTVAVREVLQRLPGRCEEVVRLRMDGYEIREIAVRLHCSRRTVERLLQEARTALRRDLDLEV